MRKVNTKVAICGFPPKVEIRGDASWGDVCKACTSYIVILGGCYLIKASVDLLLKKKKDSGQEVSKQNTTSNQATIPVAPPKAETLNEVCAKPRIGYGDLQLCGKLLS